VRAFSIPALREIGAARINNSLDPRRFNEAIITASGDILGWTGPAEAALMNVWGRGLIMLVICWPGSYMKLIKNIVTNPRIYYGTQIWLYHQDRQYPMFSGYLELSM